jgi:uncharacterized protein (TIGR02231 family)
MSSQRRSLRARVFTGVSLFLLLLAASSAHALEAGITAVTVYSDRALVTRTAELKLDHAGLQEVVFDHLPPALQEQSLQVAGKGSARVTILDVSGRLAHLPVEGNERIRGLEAQLLGLTRQMTELSDREEVLRRQQHLVEVIEASATQPPPQAQARVTVEDWTKLMVFQQEQLLSLAKARQALTVERETLQAQLDVVNAQLGELRGARGRSERNVVVRLDVAAPGTLSLDIRYMLPGASWQPSYDARLRSDEGLLELGYFGLVRNGTGEDWTQVALVLSTARPNLGGAAPEFRPWIVDVRKPVAMALEMPRMDDAALREEAVKKAIGSQPRMKSAGAVANSPAPEPMAFNADMATAAVGAGQTSATFRLSTPVSLKADNTVQKLPITTLSLKAELKHEAMPKLRETAYLSAGIVNTSDYPLLAGTLNSFLDDSFIATGTLKTVMPGEKFDLALGADEGLAIKRRLVNRFTETVGLTGKTTRVSYEVLLTLTNNRKSTAHLVFSEPLPFSRDERVEVKVTEPAERDLGTKAAPKEFTREDEGKLVARLELKPGEKREIRLKYQVEHPNELPVSGLE